MKAIVDADWNFDAVPDSELIACCYWEYARESEFILGLRKRSWDHWRPLYLKDRWWHEPQDPKIYADLEKVQSIGYPAEVFVRGISCPPDGVLPDAPPLKKGEVHKATGSFPKPWQALTPEERRYRSHIGTDVERIPLVPFRRGIFLDVKDIFESVVSRRVQRDLANDAARKANPEKSEEALLRERHLHFPDIPPSVHWASGREKTVVEINWESFTNEEIVNCFRQWVKLNRPADVAAPSGKGHKPKDWRAHLTRLAVMRLLSRFTALAIIDSRRNRFPAVWETKQFAGKKWGDPTKWHDARREAGKLFHALFPFLPREAKPISWVRPQPAK